MFKTEMTETGNKVLDFEIYILKLFRISIFGFRIFI